MRATGLARVPETSALPLETTKSLSLARRENIAGMSCWVLGTAYKLDDVLLQASVD